MKLIIRLSTVFFAVTFFNVASLQTVTAGDLNLNGFTGTVNTTVSSGFAFRASDRNCNTQAGYAYDGSATAPEDMRLGTTGLGTATVVAGNLGVDVSVLLKGGTANYDYSGTCSQRRMDGYGNISSNPLDYGSQNADDGDLNYDNGDVIDATQKMFTEITGTTDNGLGINLSFIANVNPVDDLNKTKFKPLDPDAKDDLESDISLLDAYITTSFDAGAGGYVDMTLGRSVTSWGEATFIPVGMNGMVTSALDLSALRAPGASIRDALIPTEQISFSTSLSDNVGLEVYYQFANDRLKVDPKGSFFGSELAGEGGDRILASGGYKNEQQDVVYCTYVATVLEGKTCNAATKAIHTATATRQSYDITTKLKNAFGNATAADWALWTTLGRTGDHGQLLVGSGLLVDNTLEQFTSTAADVASGNLSNIYKNNVSASTFDTGAAVQLMVNQEGKYKESSDDGQFGVRLNTYIDDIGTGVDISVYAANYHSKMPYLQIVGEGGVLAGDIMGAYNYALYDYSGSILAGDDGAGFMKASNGETYSRLLIQDALMEGAFGSGVCGGLGAALGAGAFVSDGTANAEQKQIYQNIVHKKYIDGELVHDPSTCAGTYGVNMATLIGVTPSLAGAVYPLNAATYRFIFPEDNTIIGASFNTNIAGTTVQGEVSYRPDFPLATGAGDQINQIADAAGVSAALTAFAHDTYALTAANAVPGVVLPSTVDTLFGTGTFAGLLKNVRRSSLPFISDTGGLNADYYSTAFINYDVWSVDLGTTTSFSASHPITQGLGADSAVLLTEVALVSIDGLDNMTNGFVARNGFNEGAGEHLCLGVFQGLTSAQLATLNQAIAANTSSVTGFGADAAVTLVDYDLTTNAGVTNVGAGIVDAVFGNGSYCERQMGADSQSLSYRIVGSSTYNNFNNTAWSVSPNFAWSHDPSGYGPTSLGGFTEGRMSMSLGVRAQKGDGLAASLSYVNQMGEDTANLNNDKDFVSASLSYSF